MGQISYHFDDSRTLQMLDARWSTFSDRFHNVSFTMQSHDHNWSLPLNTGAISLLLVFSHLLSLSPYLSLCLSLFLCFFLTHSISSLPPVPFHSYVMRLKLSSTAVYRQLDANPINDIYANLTGTSHVTKRIPLKCHFGIASSDRVSSSATGNAIWEVNDHGNRL